MNKSEFQSLLAEKSISDNLLTNKHNPDFMQSSLGRAKSVLSRECADNLDGFIKSGEYHVTEYKNIKYEHSPQYFVIEPYPESSFSVPASGINAFDTAPTHPLDRLVIVSGISQGWHIYGEDSHRIESKILSGDLIYKYTLT